MERTVVAEHTKDAIIRNPDNAQHAMRIKPVRARIRIMREGHVLAQTPAALRVLEVGRDYYDPVIYVPLASVSASLERVPNKTTHCPLKGNASYYTLAGTAGGHAIAWMYADPYPFASELGDHIAFYASEVVIE
ncbi:MAG: DUF427 domain-containing protein [Pseudomonadota bacterium]